MTEIYAHKFTFVPMKRERMGVRSIEVVVYSEKKDLHYFEILQEVDAVFNDNCHVTHEKMTGFQDDRS